MAKILWKIMPFVVGAAFGLFIVDPPRAFRSLGWLGWLILPACFILLIFIIFPGLLFIRQIFRDTELIAVEADFGRTDVHLLAQRLAALGFSPISPALKIPAPPATIIGFAREDVDVCAAIMRVEVGSGKTLFQFASSLGDGTKSLLTVGRLNSVLEPCAPWHFRQAFCGCDLEELFLEHVRSLEFLHARGLQTCPVSRQMQRERVLKSLQEQKEYLRKEWFTNTLLFVWRYISRTSPYRGPIAQQKIAAQYINQINGLAVETPASIARQKVLANIQLYGKAPVMLIHSGTGIASFVISLAAGFVIFAAFVFTFIVAVVTEGASDERSPVTAIIGMGLMIGGLAYAAGLVIGIKAVFEKYRKKAFAILGIVFNALGLAVLGILLLIGFLLQHHTS
jgi:hypothetical protein